MLRLCVCVGVAVLGWLALAGGTAQASEPRLIGTYGRWDAYVYEENDRQTCYAATRPDTSKNKYGRAFGPYVLVTHRPSERSRNVFSVIADEAYKPGSSVTVTIDDSKFTLFTDGNTAWARDSDDDALAKTVKSGKSLILDGVTKSGRRTHDLLSTNSAADALSQIDRECR